MLKITPLKQLNFKGKTYKDKQGNNWELNYDEKGRIISSHKNNRPYKIYSYDKPTSEDIVNDFSEHKFEDGSKLSNRGYFSISDDDVEKCSILCGKEMFFVLKNKNPIYKNEPVYSVSKIFEDGEELTKLTLKKEGTQKVEFKTLKEASDFFKKEYGINANFPSLNIAYLTKETIDDFSLINYKNKGKKLFEGLTIDYKKFDNKTDLAIFDINFESDSFDEFEQNFSNTAFDIDFLDKNDFIKLKNATLFFNTNADWEDYEINEALNYKSHSTNSAKHAMLHELGHYLHIKTHPLLNILSKDAIPKEKEILMLLNVSKRSCHSYCEFVAEYIAGKMSGIQYSKEIDKLFEQYFGEPFLD